MKDDLDEEEKTYMEKHGGKLSGIMKSLFKNSIKEYAYNYLPNKINRFDLDLTIDDYPLCYSAPYSDNQGLLENNSEILSYSNLSIAITERINKEEISSEFLDGKEYGIVD